MSTRPFEPDLLVEQPAKPPKRARTTAARARPAGGKRASRAKKKPERETTADPLLVFDDVRSTPHELAVGTGAGSSLVAGGTVDDLQLDPALFALDSLFAESTVPLASTSFAASLPLLPDPPAALYSPVNEDIDPDLTRLVARLSESAPPPDPLHLDNAYLPFAPAASVHSVAASAPRSRTASVHSSFSQGTPAGSAAPSRAATGSPAPAPAEPDPRADDIPVGSPQRTTGRKRRAARKWTAEEDAALVRLKEDTANAYVVWQEIADRIGTKHSGIQCRARYLLLKDKQKIKSSTEDNLTQGSGKDGTPLALRRRLPFRESDDAVLLSHVIDASLSLKTIDWSAVGQTLDPPRTGDSCYQRARKLKLRREAELAAAGAGAGGPSGQASAAHTPTPPPPPAPQGVGAVTPASEQGAVPPDLFGDVLAQALQGTLYGSSVTGE